MLHDLGVLLIGVLVGTGLGWWLCRKFGAKADQVVKDVQGQDPK